MDESRETMDILLTKEKARKLLEVLTPIERIPGNAIDKVLKGGETNLSILRRVKLHEFISSLTNPTLGAVLPQVEITGDQKVQTSLDSLKETKVGKALVWIGSQMNVTKGKLELLVTIKAEGTLKETGGAN
ncbi:hypothetical protein [Brevibacillus brevis]|uniref:Ger(x)C family spore germination protein n=1 Tax=Brevibacillus brevis TaxID=1393 RepID=UPI0007D8ADB2|nr:hypothetical protein [Brevibacillus brevis]